MQFRRFKVSNTFMSRMLATSILISCLLITVGAYSAELKVGYVQVEKILQDAPQTAESGKKLEREFGPRSQELDKMAKQIKDIEASLEKDGLTLTDSDRRSKERDAQNIKVEFQRKQRELREDINLRKNEELTSLQDRINKAVQAVAKTESYDLVMYSGVAYATDKIDITDKVLKQLGKK